MQITVDDGIYLPAALSVHGGVRVRAEALLLRLSEQFSVKESIF